MVQLLPRLDVYRVVLLLLVQPESVHGRGGGRRRRGKIQRTTVLLMLYKGVERRGVVLKVNGCVGVSVPPHVRACVGLVPQRRRVVQP